jgi:hypothetical protein
MRLQGGLLPQGDFECRLTTACNPTRGATALAYLRLAGGRGWGLAASRMHDWFGMIGTGCELPASAVEDLRDVGFIIISGPVAPDRLAQLAAAYDAAVASASSADLAVGSTTTRVHDLVNRGSEFDELYVYRPVLEACRRIIGQPFKLSTMLARTVRPRSQAQALHVDSGRDAGGWTMAGFIFMVDEFRSDNGATRFIPGSHNWSTTLWQAAKTKPWSVARRAPSSFTTGRSGTDIPRTRPTSRAAPSRALTSGARHGRPSTFPSACVPVPSPASARWRSMY